MVQGFYSPPPFLVVRPLKNICLYLSLPLGKLWKPVQPVLQSLTVTIYTQKSGRITKVRVPPHFSGPTAKKRYFLISYLHSRKFVFCRNFFLKFSFLYGLYLCLCLYYSMFHSWFTIAPDFSKVLRNGRYLSNFDT